jgi:hypothetical protein
MLRFRASSGRQILIARFKRADPKQALKGNSLLRQRAVPTSTRLHLLKLMDVLA